MLEGLAPDLGLRLTIAIGGVAVAFLILIAVLVFLKRRNSPLFIKGGRAREHRLLVLDAAAVDAKRRLVLIRRDDTEHLIMIGGPTDIVIETGIRGTGQPVVRAAEPAPALPERPRAEQLSAAREPRAIGAERRQQRIEQKSEPDRAARRAERQALAASQAGAAQPVEAKPVSAMGSVLYGGDEAEVSPALASSAGVTAPDVETDPMAARAAMALDLARQRVLSAPEQSPVASHSESVARTFDAQMEASKADAERAEAARMESQRAEAARAEAARLAAERAEAARIEAQRLELQRQEAARAEAARLEAERLEMQRLEAQRLEALRLEQQRADAERAEAERRAAEKAEADRVAAARAEAMARFEAARRAQAEQRQQPPRAYLEQASEPPVQQQIADQMEAVAQASLASPVQQDLPDNGQERLASDFEKLLEAELEADGVLDVRPASETTGERRDPSFGAPSAGRDERGAQPITGATPGVSIEHDMARRLGEITLNKKTDAL